MLLENESPPVVHLISLIHLTTARGTDTTTLTSLRCVLVNSLRLCAGVFVSYFNHRGTAYAPRPRVKPQTAGSYCTLFRSRCFISYWLLLQRPL